LHVGSCYAGVHILLMSPMQQCGFNNGWAELVQLLVLVLVGRRKSTADLIRHFLRILYQVSAVCYVIVSWFLVSHCFPQIIPPQKSLNWILSLLYCTVQYCIFNDYGIRQLLVVYWPGSSTIFESVQYILTYNSTDISLEQQATSLSLTRRSYCKHYLIAYLKP
jgi:hypothetical protein